MQLESILFTQNFCYTFMGALEETFFALPSTIHWGRFKAKEMRRKLFINEFISRKSQSAALHSNCYCFLSIIRLNEFKISSFSLQLIPQLFMPDFPRYCSFLAAHKVLQQNNFCCTFFPLQTS